jgi:FAD dependent oxidoreductase TIGR03364
VSAGFDVVVTGAGIVGLAHATVAARRGLRVAVVERDLCCLGASVRNFGFVTVSGQRAGRSWQRARRTREVWAEIAPAAGIAVEHRGAWLAARRPAAAAVLEAFAAGEMGAGCEFLDATQARRRAAVLHPGTRAALYSPHELRVESCLALPRLAAWLEQAHGVSFFWGETVLEVEAPCVRTSRRTLHGQRVVLCPGAELHGVGAGVLQPFDLRLTRLQMLRLRPPPGFRLPAAVMGDLSLVRYAGFAALPAAAALRAQLQDEAGECLAHGIHVIAVQSADGTLVVGDSHHDTDVADPFASEAVDALIVGQLHELLELPPCETVERWTGHYPVGHHDDVLIEPAGDAVRVVVVTSGSGASTAFAIADEVLDRW